MIGHYHQTGTGNGGWIASIRLRCRHRHSRLLRRRNCANVIALPILMASGVLWSPTSLGDWDAAVAAYQARDFSKALALLRPLVDQGDRRAQALLGDMYSFGYGVAANDAKAAEYFRAAAEAGEPQAQTNPGHMLLEGKIGPPDAKAAIVWFERAAGQCNAMAEYNLGTVYCDGRGVPNDYDKALKEYKRAANQGYADAQYHLGQVYENGTELSQDWTKARQWYERAARQNHGRAEFRLGHFYREGNGVPIDGNQAVWWYQRAAEHDYGNARLSLGLMCHAGEAGVSQNETVAARWTEKACGRRIPQACGNLAGMNFDGDGVPRDLDKGYVWMILAGWAAEKGDDSFKRQILAERDRLLGQLQPAQVTELERRANRWAAAHW